MKTHAFRFTLITLLFLTALLRAAAEQPDKVTFVFAPPVSKIMDEKARITVATSINDRSVSYGIDGTSVTKITKTEDGGYLFDTKIDNLDFTNNGPAQMDILGQLLGSTLMIGVRTIYSAEGKVERIEGMEDMRRSLAAHLPPELAGLAEGRIDNDLLLKEKRLEFQNQLGRFVGRTVTLGDLWLDVASMPLPGAEGGSPFPIYRSTRIIGWDKVGNCDVLMINIIYHASAEGLAKAINRSVKEVKAAGPAKPAAPPKGLTLYAVENMTIDPLTMRVFSDGIDTRVSYAATAPSGEKVVIYGHVTQDQKFTFRN